MPDVDQYYLSMSDIKFLRSATAGHSKQRGQHITALLAQIIAQNAADPVRQQAIIIAQQDDSRLYPDEGPQRRD